MSFAEYPDSLFIGIVCLAKIFKSTYLSPNFHGFLQVLHKPPVITEETEVDTDEVEDEVTSNQTTTTPTPTTTLVLKTTSGTRKRPVPSSGGSPVDVDSSPTPGKRGTTPMRTRQRNVSNSIKKAGIGITESSRSSIISSKNKN